MPTSYFNNKRKMGQVKRANNRENSTKILTEKCIPFTIHNGGSHLIIHIKETKIDFWPGTGKWVVRGGQESRGVFKLVDYIREISK